MDQTISVVVPLPFVRFNTVAPINSSDAIESTLTSNSYLTKPLTFTESTLVAVMLSVGEILISVGICASALIGISMARDAAEIPAMATAFPARERTRSCCSR